MLDDNFAHLKRSAIVLRPKQPFKDWVVAGAPGLDLKDDDMETNVYLAPAYGNKAEMEKWLKKNFFELFEEELFDWIIDETMWPKKRTFKMFCDWFDYSLYPIILDTQKGWIEKT
ncbi:hypothetical protein [Flavihumibacter solisilvae]|uniref:hypothetical protein n=1 Tax=Flavihumibacter solisilvae TaxID=1349421 RepID=UPI00068EE4E6|nr:hypothetical protein [Flavihumibacter solisilvae]